MVAGDAAATRPAPSSTRPPSASTSTSTSPSRRERPPSSWPSAASSTTSSGASTAAPSPTRRARSGSWPPPSSRPPTPDGRSPAGTSRTSRPAFAVTLDVPEGLLAVSNTREVARQPLDDGTVRVHFAETHGHVDLPGGLRRRPPRGHRPGARRRCRPPRGAPHRQGRPGPLRARGGRLLPRPPGGLVRHRLPGRQARPRRRARLRLRRHGEPRLRDLPRGPPAGRPVDGHPARAAERGRRHRPRAGPHVVRRPGDHALVERHLAERGLRHVHGDAHHRRLPPRLGAVGRLRRVPLRGAGHRRPAHAPVPSSSRSPRPRTPRACSTSSPTRRAPPSCGCSSSTWARSGSGTASAATSTPTSTPTPRPPTCGTPSRRPPASPPGGSWTPGSSRAATRWSAPTREGDRLVLTQERFTYLPGAEPARWAVPVLVAWGTDGGETTTERVLLDGDRAEVDLTAAPTGSWSTGAGPASTGSPTPPSCGRRWPIGPTTLLEPIERYQFVDDLAAAALAGRVPATDAARHRPARSPTRPTCPCGSASSARCTGSADWSTARPEARFTELAATLLAPAYERLGPLPGRRRERPGRRAAGPPLRRPRAPWPRTPTPDSGRPTCTGPTCRTGPRSTRRWPRRRPGSWPMSARPRTTKPSSPASSTPPTPRRSSATSTCWPTSRTPDCSRAPWR